MTIGMLIMVKLKARQCHSRPVFFIDPKNWAKAALTVIAQVPNADSSFDIKLFSPESNQFTFNGIKRLISTAWTNEIGCECQPWGCHGDSRFENGYRRKNLPTPSTGVWPQVCVSVYFYLNLLVDGCVPEYLFNISRQNDRHHRDANLGDGMSRQQW